MKVANFQPLLFHLLKIFKNKTKKTNFYARKTYKNTTTIISIIARIESKPAYFKTIDRKHFDPTHLSLLLAQQQLIFSKKCRIIRDFKSFTNNEKKKKKRTQKPEKPLITKAGTQKS